MGDYEWRLNSLNTGYSNDTNRYMYHYNGLNSNATYMNSTFGNTVTKNEAQQWYDELGRFLANYNPTDITKKTQVQTPYELLDDDTEIPIDLGDGKTTTVKYKDLKDNIEAYEQDIDARKDELDKIEENLDENGNSRVVDDTLLSEMSFGQKAGKVGIGLLNGGFKFVKSFFGMEDGWKGFKNGGWKRCLANVGIAAGTIALCSIPVVGPVLGTAFLWITRGDAIVNTAKGVVGICKAKTAGELESAAENLGVAAVEIAGGRTASKRIRVKGGQSGAKFGIRGKFKQFKAELKATGNMIAQEKNSWNVIKKTYKKDGLFKRLIRFAAHKRTVNKRYCANKNAYTEQKQQMLDNLNKSNSTNKQQGFFGKLRNNNSLKPRTNSTEDKAVMDRIAEIENKLGSWRKKRIEFNTKSQIDNAIYEKKGSLNKVMKQEIANILEGKGTLGQTIKNDDRAKALFLQEMERLIAEERQFNRQYKQLYKVKTKRMGAQMVRGINPDEVTVYTGKPGKFGQLWALNKKPQDMGWVRFLGKLGFKTFWDGAMLTYNGGKAIVGTPYSAMPLARHMINPHEFDGEYFSADYIEKERQNIKAEEEQLEQLKELKRQIEENYGIK